MKQIYLWIKPYLRWVIFGGTVFFLLKSFKDNWQEVVEIKLTSLEWHYLAIAFLVTTIAHLFSGSVWILILKAFKQSIEWPWGLRVYLKTNIAKYLPGNVWHFYGRVVALKNRGNSLTIASISVLVEPLLIAATALMIALAGFASGNLSSDDLLINEWLKGFLLLMLGGILICIHPRILNPILKFLNKIKGIRNDSQLVQIDFYPWLPVLSAMAFLILRGVGFIFALLAFMPVHVNQLILVLSVFTLAWLLGLVIPGAPGGIGVFETTALTFLEPEFPIGLLLSALAIFRVISISAEVTGAALAVISEHKIFQK
ncbi:MAG TPA: hypothetical protein DCF68_01540 [Cyanothece sp. UBA12306]|nr:hypothetical protein [Cyanothece sp. UBA12306]